MKAHIPLTLAALLVTALSFSCRTGADAINRTIPAPALDASAAGTADLETAVLAGGCFWGMQGVFEHVRGVTKVVAGYSGGRKETATYDQVTTETTGHAESVEITFDPKQISFGRLLQIYFSVAHDPTELDRQGPDSGPSYRSEIFFTSPAQERVARAYIAQLDQSRIYRDKIVTKIEPLQGFYAAEAYHQDFLIHNPNYPYIVYNDKPKIAALERLFPEVYREQPVTLGTGR